MNLLMTGIDHTRADLDTRSEFAVTRERSQRLVKVLTQHTAVNACVIVSTCNRTELYASLSSDLPADFSLTELFCTVLDKNYHASAGYFAELADARALEHLCHVAAGLDSQILGDDQIITQSREALELSRAENCTDSYLETFFRIAIQTAKAIKTNVILKALGAASVSQETILKLQQMVQLEGKRVVVIGNGVVGRHVATLLVQAGAVVTVTIREYRRGVVEVPPGAYTINYSSRYQAINQADIVVSATTSNHFTVRTEDLAACSKLPEIVIDLAVPRDVEAQVGDMAGVTLLTVDDIASEAKTLSPESLEMIDALIKKNLARFANWNKSKRLLNKNALLPIGADGAEVTPRWSQAAGRKG